ncbi:MAG: formylglycine-generating enzyme family protein [Treponema sp.]|nr:formylglycine-generating enzyme family protein [Treponema sp.]
MMKETRFMAVAVAALMAACVSFAGCGGSSSSSKAGGESKASEAKAAKATAKKDSEVKVGSVYVMKTEVTQAQYKAVTGANPSKFAGNDDWPVERVSWYDALAFCNLLSEKEGLKPCYSVNGSTNAGKWGEGGKDYKDKDVERNEKANGWRLPTVEEWLAAADDGHLYSGGDNIDDVAWYVKNSDDHPQKIGTKAANANGLYDMTGNVYEWCWDKEGSGHIRLGGSWSSNTDQCAVSKRSSGSRGGDITGFRPVRNAN